MIIKSAEDGAHIIRRIQDFARQRPSREFEAISIAELLKDICEMTRPSGNRAPNSLRFASLSTPTAMPTSKAILSSCVKCSST